MNRVDGELWHAAADFAALRHRDQVRKDGVTPYIAHPMRVALTVTSVFGCNDPEVLAAAILHDTIEDTQTDYEDLSERFGPWVADAVAALTVNKALPEREREAEYHGRLSRAEWRVLLIKLADAWQNVSDAACGPDQSLRERCLRKSGKVAELARARADESPLLATAVARLDELRRRASSEAD